MSACILWTGAKYRNGYCPRGHAYDAANTYEYNGERQCRACNRESHRRRYATGRTP